MTEHEGPIKEPIGVLYHEEKVWVVADDIIRLIHNSLDKDFLIHNIERIIHNVILGESGAPYDDGFYKKGGL